MFVQAGVREDGKPICIALVRRYGRRWRRASILFRFPPAEYAWGGERGLSWPEQIVITTFEEVRPRLTYSQCLALPRSELRHGR